MSLFVQVSGRKYWHFRYTHLDRPARVSLDVYPSISLQEARERAAECRKLLKDDINPGAKQRDDKQQQREAGLADSDRSHATLKKIRDYRDKDSAAGAGSEAVGGHHAD